MTETRYVYLKLPIVVEDNKFCAKSCPGLERAAGCCQFATEPNEQLTVSPSGRYVRTISCLAAEVFEGGFAYEIDPDCSVIVLKKD